MGTFVQDARHALRMLRKNPGFTTIAVLTLALGIGANTAMFSVVDSVLLKPLPYDGADRLVWLNEETPQLSRMSVSYPNFQDWKAQAKSFEKMAASQNTSVVLTGAGEPEVLNGRNVSAEFFSTLRLQPARGRDFAPADDKPGAAPVAIISETLRQRRFGDADPLGKAITVDRRVYTVVGILAPGPMPGMQPADVYMPIGLDADRMKDRGQHPGIYVLARLKPDVSVEQVRAELSAIARGLAEQYPTTNAKNTIRMVSMKDNLIGNVRPALLTLLLAVGCVLLIACANVANLLLARGTGREREIAIRVALGATRGRIIRQLLTESVVLAGAGAALGMLLAVWTLQGVLQVAPDDLPRLRDVGLNLTVLLFTAAAALATGILFGLVPALHAMAPQLSPALKEGSHSTASSSRHRARKILVVGEVALSVVLLVASGLLIRSFLRLQAVNPGFDPAQVLVAELPLPPFDNLNPAERAHVSQFYAALDERLNHLPGVAAAAIDTPAPMSGSGWQTDYRVEGEPLPANGEFPNTDINYVTGGFFRALRIAVKSGRVLNDGDRVDTPYVAVVNETFAQHHWPGGDPVGRRIRLGGADELTGTDEQKAPWLTIVGVVKDVKQYGLDQPIRDAVYVSMLQSPVGYTNVLVRSKGFDPRALTNAVREAVRSVDSDQPITNVSTMEEFIATSVASRRLTVVLLGIFAGLAMLLAAIGIYGVLSYSVAERTQEIGVRMALGATRAAVLQMVFREAGRLALIGLAAGTVLALISGRLLESLLFGVGPSDPATFATVIVLLGGVAAFASLVPAHKATNVDPMIALRHE